MALFEKYLLAIKVTSAMLWGKLSAQQNKLLLGGGIALTLILRLLLAKETKFISNLSRVGLKVGVKSEKGNSTKPPRSEVYGFYEYDVIIVGGGQSPTHFCQSNNWVGLCQTVIRRHCRVRLGCTANRGYSLTCSSVGSRWKVCFNATHKSVNWSTYSLCTVAEHCSFPESP